MTFIMKYNSQYRLYELSHYMFKLSTGWPTNMSAVPCGSLPQCFQ